MRLVSIFIIFLLVSCNVSRQRSTSVQSLETSDLKESVESQERIIKKEFDFGRQSITNTGSNTLMQIIPRGVFRILPDGTFEGEAEEIRSYRRDTTVKHEDERSNIKEEDESRTGHELKELSTHQSFDMEEERETRRRPGWAVVLFWIAVAVLGLLFTRSQLKRFRII
jgi:hypothetical protein